MASGSSSTFLVNQNSMIFGNSVANGVGGVVSTTSSSLTILNASAVSGNFAQNGGVVQAVNSIISVAHSAKVSSYLNLLCAIDSF